eukprot:4975895-Pyramimonas_sp.AAC.1
MLGTSWPVRQDRSPRSLQDIYGAELYAVLMILRHAGPGDLVLGIDCEALIESLRSFRRPVLCHRRRLLA